jgi:hypothetical protein
MKNPTSRLRRALRWLLIICCGLLVAVAAARYLRAARSHPGHQFALARAANSEPKPLRVGLARAKINPPLNDPAHPVWLAGFSQNRRATAIHDDLWAVAVVIDDGYTRLAIVSLDSIGVFHDDVLALRAQLGRELGLTYTIVCATHNHSTPDLMGLWGPNPLRTGVDPAYRTQVLTTAAQTVAQATTALTEARLALHEVPVPPTGFLADTRLPLVFDSDLRVMHFTAASDGHTLGSIVTWGNHPETPWSKNTEITSDFCGALRTALEQGVTPTGQPPLPGLGGIHCFINGAVGGLMTTHPSVTVRDPVTGKDLKTPSHDKSRAVGQQLALRLLPVLRAASPSANSAPITIRARTLELPVANRLMWLAPALGLLDRGQSRWGWVRTEVAFLQIGDASLVCVPGEIYPEIVNGGIEHPIGADFAGEPVEVPPLRTLMPGRVKFVFGLANDEIGYIIPRSEWDEAPPYLYGATRAVYGEVNSLGPETAPRLHQALRQLIETPQ